MKSQDYRDIEVFAPFHSSPSQPCNFLPSSSRTAGARAHRRLWHKSKADARLSQTHTHKSAHFPEQIQIPNVSSGLLLPGEIWLLKPECGAEKKF